MVRKKTELFPFYSHRMFYLLSCLVALIVALSYLIIPGEYKIEFTLIIGFITLFGTIAVRDFFKSLCIFIFANPLLFSLEVGSNFPISLQGLASILVIAIGLSYFFLEGLLKKRSDFPAINPFLLILIFSSLSFLYSPDTPSVFLKVARIASYFSLYVLLLAHLDSWKKVESLIKVVYLSYLVPILIAFLQLSGIFFQNRNLIELEMIGFMSKNSLGIIVAMLTLFLIGSKLLKNESIIKVARNSLLYFVPLITLLILSVTRTAWIGFLGTLLLTLTFYGRAKNRIVILLCFLTIVLIFWYPIVESVSDLININLALGTISHSNYFKGSLEGRLFLYWPQGIEMWLESPIFGHGLGSTKFLALNLSNIIAKSPHNEYIQILQELGVVGFTLYLFLLWKLLSPMRMMNKVALRNDLTDQRKYTIVGSMMVFIGFIIMSFGQETFHNGAIGMLFIIFMAVAQATYLLLKKDSKRIQPYKTQ